MTPNDADAATRVAEAIAEVRALAADKSTPQATLVAKAHALVALAPLSVASVCEVGQELYRGTNHHKAVPLHRSEISYPPARVTDYGRANCIGKPVFYCSTDPNGVFRELCSSVGQYAVLAKWVTTRPLILHGLGYAPSVFLRAKARRQAPSHYTVFDARVDDVTRLVREFFAMEFTRPDDCDYRLTAAFAEVFTAGDDIAGILYPTVAKDCNSDNVALIPAFADSGLRLVEARVVLIDQIEPDGSVGGQVVASLESCTEGQLAWKYTGTSSTNVPANSAAVVRLVPGARSRVEQACEVILDGLTYKLEPGYSIEVVDDTICVLDLQGGIVSPVKRTAPVGEFWPERYGNDVNQYIRRFEALFAFVLEELTLNDARIAVSAWFAADFVLSDSTWTLTMRDGQGLEMHDPSGSGERIALAIFIHDVQRASPEARPVGIVIDALPGTLEGMNARTEPVHQEFYLPDGFELVYGCRGSENELAVNAMLAFCRSELGNVLRAIQRGDLPELKDVAVSALYKRVRRIAFDRAS